MLPWSLLSDEVGGWSQVSSDEEIGEATNEKEQQGSPVRQGLCWVPERLSPSLSKVEELGSTLCSTPGRTEKKQAVTERLKRVEARWVQVYLRGLQEVRLVGQQWVHRPVPWWAVAWAIVSAAQQLVAQAS